MKIVQNLITRLTEFPLQEVHDRAAQSDIKQAIPPVLYQTWADNRFGKTHARSIQDFRALNPDLSFHLFDDAALAGYMAEHWGDHPIHEIFDKAVFGPMKADIFRYCILLERGGYYFDIAKGCTQQLTTLHDRDTQAMISFGTNDEIMRPAENVASLMQHPDKRLLQWAFGFAPQHPIMQRMIDAIVAAYPFFIDREFENPKNAILMLTGPGMFNRTVRDVLAENGAAGITQCGLDFFGKGVFELPGSRVRYATVPGYANLRNAKIIC